MDIRLLLEDENSADVEFYKFSLFQAFLKSGLTCEMLVVPAPKRTDDFTDGLRATVTAAKKQAARQTGGMYCVYLATGTTRLASENKKVTVALTPLIVLHGEKIIRASLEPLEELSSEASQSFAYAAMELQRMWPMDGANKQERETAARLADLAVDGLLTGVELILNQHPIIHKNKLD